MTAPIVFSIPAVPQSRNRQRTHWRVQAADDRLWRNFVDMLPSQSLGRIAGPVVVTLTFYSPRPPDPDNVARPVLNAMKPRRHRVGGKMVTTNPGVIDDDDWRTVTELRLRSRQGAPRTEVRVEAAP